MNYKSVKAINQSLINACLESPFHGYQYLTKPQEQTTEMSFGQLVHALLLEPKTALDAFYIIPKGAKTASHLEAAKGRTMIREQYLDQAKQVVADAMKSKIVSKLIAESAKELWLNFEVDGTPCKARVDGITADGTLYDIKTTRYSNPSDFYKWSMRQYGYDVQAAFYMEALRRNNYEVKQVCIIAINKEKSDDENPTIVMPIRVGVNTIEEGNKKIVQGFPIAKKLLEGFIPEQPHDFIDMDYFDVM